MVEEYAWYCVRTQVKREHIAASQIRERLGLEVVCPRVKFRKATKRGKVWWLEAMFPGYIFVRFCRPEHERAVRYAQGVLTIVSFGEWMPEVGEAFIVALRSSLNEAEVMELVPKVGVGDELEVAHGPLKGESGVVLEILPSAERVQLLIEFVGHQQVVDVDLYSLILPERREIEGRDV